MPLFNAYQQRLLCTSLSFLAVMLLLYGVLSSNKSDDNSLLRQDSSARPIQGNKASPLVAKAPESCAVMPPQYSTPGRPVWVAGYPGSGFDLAAPIIAKVTGLTAVDVYRHHTCSTVIQEGAAVTGACMTHWPMIKKDSPAAVATGGEFYSPQAMFIIRNPIKAIPSYFTRWWGAQRHVMVRSVFHPNLS